MTNDTGPDAKFDLDDLCWQVMESDVADRDEVAERVARAVPHKHLRTALRQAMPKYIAVKFSQQRRAYAFPPPPVELEQPNGTPPSDVHRRQSANSAKVKAIRAGWRKALNCRLWCGPKAGDKLIANCGYEDLMTAAQQRRRTAKRMNASADRIEEVAAAVQEHDVLSVADLPEDVLEELFGDNPEEFEE